MAKLNGQAIRELARSIVTKNPDGIRYRALVARIASEHPETPKGTIVGSVRNLERLFAGEVAKPSRGLYVPASGIETAAAALGMKQPRRSAIPEEDFYEPLPSGSRMTWTK